MKCPRCVLDDSRPGVTIGKNGQCNMCDLHDEMAKKYPRGTDALTREVNKIRDTRGKYNCIIGISGGCDSSTLLVKAVTEWGLRPLAVSYDNTYTTQVATDNIYNLTSKLDVDLDVVTVDFDIMDEINRAFLRARVPDMDAATDVALAKVLMAKAASLGIKYVLDAHDFRSEGTTPLGWLYFDGKYVNSVWKRFGDGGDFSKFPNLWMKDQLYYLAKKIQRPRLLYYTNYDRDIEAEYMKREWGWKEYGGKHAENMWTKFADWVWDYEAFGMDLREVFLSAKVRSGKMTRNNAIAELMEPPLKREERDELVNYVEDRLVMDLEGKIRELKAAGGSWRSYKDFETYLPTFHRYAPLFKMAGRMGLVPETFVKKYCE